MSTCSFSPSSDSQEYIDGTLAGSLGEVLIRCNNVMYLRQAPTS